MTTPSESSSTGPEVKTPATPAEQICKSEDCGKPATRLECPKCKELDLKDSFFCSQECFKQNYKLHAENVHKVALRNKQAREALLSNKGFDPWANRSRSPYTGTLRAAYPLSPRRTVPEHIQRPDYAQNAAGRSRSEEFEQMRHARLSQEQMLKGRDIHVLTEEEKEKMRTVCRLAREVLDIAAAAVRPGITTDEIDEIVHKACIERDSYPSPLGYYKFPKSVCTSINEVICHGIPDRRPLEEGDIINLDVTLFHKGYHGDLNATYPVGKVDEESAKLIKVTRECLDAAIALCKAGAAYKEIGRAIQPIAERNGMSVVRTFVGHGIHKLFHSRAPNIYHYKSKKAVGFMKPGHVFTIEPMINLGPDPGDTKWPDDWTVATLDGKRSAQFEETILITEDGCEVLTAPPKAN